MNHPGLESPWLKSPWLKSLLLKCPLSISLKDISGVVKSLVGKFMVKKSRLERSGVEAWGWKVWDWNVFQPYSKSIAKSRFRDYISVVVQIRPQDWIIFPRWITNLIQNGANKTLWLRLTSFTPCCSRIFNATLRQPKNERFFHI